MNLHSRVAFLPYVPYTRKVLIFNGARVPAGVSPSSIGEHVLKKRLGDRLTRRVLATRLGTTEHTIMNWELGRSMTIPVKAFPAVVLFLGYNPETKPDRIGPQLRWKRRSLGWTVAQAARRNSVNPSSWEAWEKLDGWPPYPRYRAFLEEFLRLPAEELNCMVRQVAPASPKRSQKV